MQHYMLLQRNLIYTGITRAKQLLVLVGQKKALGIAVRNDRSQKRYSGCEGFALAAPSPQLEGALDHLADGDRRVSIALGVRPRIRRSIQLRVKLMQNGARTRQFLRPGTGCLPVFVQKSLAGGDKLRQFAFGLKLDFQLSNVKVLRLPKLTQEDGVHQLGNSLRDLPCVGLLRHFKKDDLCWCIGVNKVEQVAGAGIVELLLEEISEFLA